MRVRAVAFNFNGTLSLAEAAETVCPTAREAVTYAADRVPPIQRVVLDKHGRVEITDAAGRKAWANPLRL